MSNWQDQMEKQVKQADITALSLYDCAEVVNDIEKIAEENDGELSEHQLQKLVEAQTQSIVKLEKLCGAIAHYEQGIDFCKKQEARIKEARQRAEKRIESVKKYLSPFVVSKGKPIQAGTFTLSTRRSTSTVITGTITDPEYLRVVPATTEPDKEKIKEALKSGKEVRNAELQTNFNIQIK